MLVTITTVAIISTNIPEAMGREPPREVNHSFEKDREKDPGGTQQTSARINGFEIPGVRERAARCDRV